MTDFKVVLLVLICFGTSVFVRSIRNVNIRTLRVNSDTCIDNQQPTEPKFFVILNNLQSGSNIGSICRNALAFNASEVILVGKKGVPQMRQTDRGARGRLAYKHFFTVREAACYLKAEHNCLILGIEITDDATPITRNPFHRATAFMFGNEGGGLSPRQREACDGSAYIPQYAAGMASINVACASAIVMQTFAVWAQFPENERIGEKFIL